MDWIPKSGVGNNPKIMLIAGPRMLLLSRIKTPPTIMSKPHRIDVSDIEAKTVLTWSGVSSAFSAPGKRYALSRRTSNIPLEIHSRLPIRTG